MPVAEGLRVFAVLHKLPWSCRCKVCFSVALLGTLPMAGLYCLLSISIIEPARKHFALLLSLIFKRKLMISHSFFWCSLAGHIPAHNRDFLHVLLSLGWYSRDSDLNLSTYKSRKGRERVRVPSSHHRWLIISVLPPSPSQQSKYSFLVTMWWIQAVLHLSNVLGKNTERLSTSENLVYFHWFTLGQILHVLQIH